MDNVHFLAEMVLLTLFNSATLYVEAMKRVEADPAIEPTVLKQVVAEVLTKALEVSNED